MIEEAPTGITRRAVTTAAAWSVPAVALAVGTPLAAASNGDLHITFNLASYSSSVCDDLIDVTATVTTSTGAPAPLKNVIVTLPPGLFFVATNSTTGTFVTDQNGQVHLGVIGTRTPGTYTITATTDGGASSASQVTVIAASNTWYTQEDGNTTGGEIVVSGMPFSTPRGSGYFLVEGTPGSGQGALYYFGTLVNSNVSSVVTYEGPTAQAAAPGGDYALALVGGVWTEYRNGNPTPTNVWPAVPAAAAALGNGYFSENGRLWYQNAIIVSSGVEAGAQGYGGRTGDVGNWVDVKVNGLWYRLRDGATPSPANAVSVDPSLVAVGAGYFWSPSTHQLFYLGTLFQANVARAIGFRGGDAIHYVVDLVKDDGSFYQMSSGTGPNLSPQFNTLTPSDEILGQGFFLRPNGDLYWKTDLIATGVADVATYTDYRGSGNVDRGDFVQYVVPDC